MSIPNTLNALANVEEMSHEALVALCRERDFERRTNICRINGLSEELWRLRALCDEQRRQLAAYASGEVIIGLGRRLMALSAANDGLRDAIERERELRASLAAAQAECRRLAAGRDAPTVAGNSPPALPALSGRDAACGQDAQAMPDKRETQQ